MSTLLCPWLLATDDLLNPTLFGLVANAALSRRLIEKDYLEREGNAYTYLA